MVSELRKHVSWNVFGNVGGKLLAPFFQLLIARQLLPDDYGTFGIATALIYIYDVVKDLGFTEAIIVGQSEKDIGSQFTLQIVTASIMYVIVVLSAPYFAIFYGDHRYMTVLPIMGLVFFIKAIVDPLTTLYLKEQKFNLLAMRQLVFPIVFGAVGYILASFKYGVYSLVFATVAANIAVAACFYVKRTEALKFEWDPEVKKKLFKLGKHIVLQRVAGFLVHQADSFTVGKILGMMNLGMYKISESIANLVPNCVVGQTQQVLFTELSKQQIDPDYVDHRYQHFIRYSGLFLTAYVIAISMISPIFVIKLMGDQWGGIVPFVQIFSASVVTGYLANMNNDLGKILGLASMYTCLSLYRSIFTIICVTAMAFISLKAAACAWVMSGIIANMANEIAFHRSQKIIRISSYKIIFYITSICWFIFIVIAIYYKPSSLFFIIDA